MGLKHRRRKRQRRSSELTSHIIEPNTTGFASLPAELLLEIISYLPTRFPVPYYFIHDPTRKTPIYTRQATIMTLVQLCRSFRRSLIRYLWEEVIICSFLDGRRNVAVDREHICAFVSRESCYTCERRLALEIVAQLETITVRVPEYAARVQAFSVFIPRYSEKSIVPELARCLSLLPNLKTLQIGSNTHGDFVGRAIEQAFPHYQYESVQTLVIAARTGTLAMLKACPNVLHLHFAYFPGYLQGQEVFPKITKFTGVIPYNYRLQRSMPNLKYVQVMTQKPSFGIIPARVRMDVLAQLSKLEVIEIALMQREAKGEADELYKAAQSLISRMPRIHGVERRVEVCDYTDLGFVR